MNVCLVKMVGNDSKYNVKNITYRKVKFWNRTNDNIKTQTLTTSVDIKYNRHLQLMDHQGRASPNYNHV